MIRIDLTFFGALVVVLSSMQVHAADPVAGKKSAVVCAACHGASGVSVSADIPNLAGQKAKYLLKQLMAFREGKRVNALMSPMAKQLSDEQMANLAAYFASLPGGDPGDSPLVRFPGTRLAFPEGYKDTFTQYTTSNRTDNGTVRYLFANDIAMTASASGKTLPTGSVIVMEVYKTKFDSAGKPIVGADGVFENVGLAGYGVMENRTGWGNEYPAQLRNGDWSYAFFTPEKKHKKGINEAKCLACHQPLSDANYMFTNDALKTKASK